MGLLGDQSLSLQSYPCDLSPLCIFFKSSTPSTTRSKLPGEVLDYILQSLNRSELVPCLTVNSVFYCIASRICYHTLEDMTPSKSIVCLRVLETTPRLQTLVRKLDIDWNGTHASAEPETKPITPTGNLYRLLHRVLQKLLFLTILSLELPRVDTPSWILSGCTFSLRSFFTSLPCDPGLARFLETQPALMELTLRGFQQQQWDSTAVPFLLYGGLGAPEKDSTTFTLEPSALPNLSTLRTVHGGPSLIASIVRGRPVRNASIALFSATSSESLKALSLSAASMRRLSIMSFDPAVQDYLLSELATRFPLLEALHVVILLSEYTNDLLKALGPLLSGFHNLQYITFMASTDRPATPAEEQEIAQGWHRSCPTLKTIILPRGKVWFEGQTDWSALDSEDGTS